MQIDKVLGIVGVLYVGEYDPEKHYEYLNCTTHNGSSYICVNPDGVTGIEPGTTDDWQLSAKQGDVGPVGPKPVNGVDYNTDEEKEEFKNEVVSTATTEVKQNIETIKEEAIQEFNSNASTKTNEYNDNTTTKLSEYNTNANSKVEEYNSNATQKTNTFNENATTQTETFNNNATSKTNDFNSNASTKTDEFNTNYEEKLESINEASTSIEQERVISDGKYPRALKTPVTDVESTQIYAENNVINNLILKGAELTQVVTENSPSLDNPSEVQVTNEQNIQITKNNLFNLSSVTLTHITIENNLLTTDALNTYGNFSIKNSIKLFKGDVYLSFDIRLVSGTLDVINKAILNESLETSLEMSRFGSTQVNNNWTRIKFKATLDKIYDLKRIWVQVGNATSAILEVKNVMISYYDVDYEDYYDINNITIPLTNSAIGQYTDTIDRENNVQNKVIQKLTLTGYENWSLQTSPNRFDVYNVPVNALKNAQLCTHFKTYNEYANAKGTFALGGNYIRVYNDNNMTLEEWKAFLAQQNQAGTPVKFYYVAVSPTTNPLSEEVQTALSNFKLYQDLNNIAIDGGSMSFIYNKSLSKTIEEMQDEIQSKDTLIQNLTTRVEALEKAQIDSATENLGGN